MAGRLSLLRLLLGLSSMVILVHHCLELLAGVESHHAPRCYRNFFARLGVPPRTLRLVTELEVAEARQLHALAIFESLPHLFEEALDHVLRLALVQTDFFEQEIS